MKAPASHSICPFQIPEKLSEVVPMVTQGREARAISAPFLKFDLQAHLARLKTEDQWQRSDRNAITLLKTPSICVMLLALHKGARMRSHEVNGSMTLLVLDGSVRFVVGETISDLEPDSLLSLEPGILHEVVAVEDCAFLLTIAYSSDHTSSR
jgi:quercetin dioxygenase-like cupin family protein